MLELAILCICELIFIDFWTHLCYHLIGIGKDKRRRLSATIGLQERVRMMATWNDYKEHVRATNPEIAKDIDEAEAISQIVGAMIERRHDLKLSQRDLANLCGIPHSSVARIESGKTTPNLSTLLKIFRELGLSLVAEPINE